MLIEPSFVIFEQSTSLYINFTSTLTDGDVEDLTLHAPALVPSIELFFHLHPFAPLDKWQLETLGAEIHSQLIKLTSAIKRILHPYGG